MSDFASYQSEFLRLFGFGLEGVDYLAETNPDLTLPLGVEIGSLRIGD
ncbi:MAG: hypothetical protein KDN20_06540 [Verrucomicrobiae bacterium]|nr:hypothetical protein [Verrucomicrobiae bacterium]